MLATDEVLQRHKKAEEKRQSCQLVGRLSKTRITSSEKNNLTKNGERDSDTTSESDVDLIVKLLKIVPMTKTF